MGTSRTIAVVGLRTMPRAGWRADIGSALGFVRARPDTWLLGIIGVALRGAIVLLMAPILVLPTQVETRLLLGDNLGSTGLTQGFWGLVVGATLVTVLALLGIFYVLARVELGAYARLVRDEASAEQRDWREPRLVAGRVRTMLLARLFTVQAIGALGLLVSALPLAVAIRDAVLLELLGPTSPAPFFVRVAGHVTQQAFAVVIAIALVEVLTAAASRALLGHAFGLDAHRPRVRGGSAGLALRGVARALLTQPLRTLADAALGWALFIGTLAAGTWLIGISWHATRLVFLANSWTNAIQQSIALFSVAALLAATFCLALLGLGFVSAVRASLASLASLR